MLENLSVRLKVMFLAVVMIIITCVVAGKCFLAESGDSTKEIGETLEIKNKIVKQISHKEKTPFLSLAVWGSRLHKKLINGLSLSQ